MGVFSGNKTGFVRLGHKYDLRACLYNSKTPNVNCVISGCVHFICIHVSYMTTYVGKHAASYSVTTVGRLYWCTCVLYVFLISCTFTVNLEFHSAPLGRILDSG